jgi:hypothetical protein
MTEPDSKRESEIAERARELFAESVAGLDGHTRSRLSRARAAAVAAAAERGPRSWLVPWRPASPWRAFSPLLSGGVAVALVALFSLAVVLQAPDAPVATATPVVLNDLDLLLEGESLDFFEELEFYAWLLEQPELLEADASGDDSG